MIEYNYKRFLKTYLYCALFVFSLSCSDDIVVDEVNEKEKNWNGEILLQVSGVEGNNMSRGAVADLMTFFDRRYKIEGDDDKQHMFLYVCDDETTYSKTELVVNSTNDGLTTLDGSPVYYPEDVEKVDLYVVAAGNGPTFPDRINSDFSVSIPGYQNGGRGNKADVLYASVEDVVPSANPVSLTFKHMATNVSIAVVNETEPKVEYNKLEVLVQNITTKFNLYSEAWNITGGNSWVETDLYRDNESFYGCKYGIVYMPPQTINQGTQFIKISNKDDNGITPITYALENTMEFKQGYQYKFHITLGGDGTPEVAITEIKMISVISPWTDKVYDSTVTMSSEN